MNIALTDDHRYVVDGKRYPGVTSIISEAVGSQWRVADWYLDRGKAIHKCAEFIAKGKEFSFDDRLAGYVAAIKKVFADLKPTVYHSTIERMVFSNLYKYCGTIDIAFNVGRRRIIVDWKHSVDKERVALQLGGYSQAFYESDTAVGKFDYGLGIEIHEDGTYKCTEIMDLRKSVREFLALRTTYAVKDRMGLLTINKG